MNDLPSSILSSINATPAKLSAAGGRACGDCLWSTKAPNDIRGIARECHARPPAAYLVQTPTGAGFMTAFPTVQPDQWCGEFKPAVVN